MRNVIVVATPTTTHRMFFFAVTASTLLKASNKWSRLSRLANVVIGVAVPRDLRLGEVAQVASAQVGSGQVGSAPVESGVCRGCQDATVPNAFVFHATTWRGFIAFFEVESLRLRFGEVPPFADNCRAVRPCRQSLQDSVHHPSLRATEPQVGG